uniref:NADH:ubiquinone oxidoreductase n=1 Tax=Thermodesulfobium narugense TaxID=184064 RepID=A0A7C5KBW1_9BACT
MFWPIYGLTKKYTEKNLNIAKLNLKQKNIKNIFKRSIHIFCIDVGNDNALNFEIFALMSPKYNLHRFGIFFTQNPREADLLIILGKPTEKMVPLMLEAINQMPEPFGVLLTENNDLGINFDNFDIPNVIGHIKGDVSRDEILSYILAFMKGDEKK